MKKRLLKSTDLKPKLKCEESVIVEYYISEDESDDENYNEKKPFGIEVVKKQKINGNIYREIKSVRHLTNNVNQAEKLLSLLHRNSVTPITVGEILEDLSVK